MAIALVAHTAAGSAGGNTVTTSGITTSGANLLIVMVSEGASENPVTAGLSDSNSNTWTALTSQNTSSTSGALFYCLNPTVGAGHTFTFTHSSFFPGIAVLAFSGVNTAGTDGQSGATGDGLHASLQPGSITPSAANDLFVTGLGYGASRTMAIDSSFTITDQIDFLASGGNEGIAAAYKIKSSDSTAENPTWSWTTNLGNVVAVMVAFKAAGASPSPFFTTTADLPQPAKPSILNLTWLQQAQLVPPAGTPITPGIFPNPALAKPFHFGYSDYYVEDVSVPFLGNTSTNFPNPFPVKVGGQSWVFTPLGATLQPIPPPPFFGNASANPTLTVPRQPSTWLVNLLESTLQPIPPPVTKPVGFTLVITQRGAWTLGIYRNKSWTTTIQ